MHPHSFSTTKMATPTGWPLRFKPLERMAIIGKFDEKIDFEKAKKPIRMYRKDESAEILEESEPIDVKPIDYRKKRQRRRFLKSKEVLVIEDSTFRDNNINGVSGAGSSARGGLQFEGRVANLFLADEEAAPTRSMKAPPGNKIDSEGSFKYVLLQVVKKPVESGEERDGSTSSSSSSISATTTEVNVIPVGDWYTFKKPTASQKMLDEIDDEFELKLIADKKKLSKYRRLAEVLGKDNKEGSSVGGRVTGDYDDDEIDGNGGFVLPAAFGRATSKSSKRGGSAASGGGGYGRRADDKSVASGEGVGEDPAVAAEFEAFGGDYTRTFADDEEENVGMEQVGLDDGEDFQAGRSGGLAPALLLQTSLGEEDDEEFVDSDEDEDSDSDSGTGVGGTGMRPASGFVDAELERSAKEYGRAMAQQKQQQQQMTKAAGSDSSGDQVTSDMGTEQPVDSSDDIDAAKAAQVVVTTNVTSLNKKRGRDTEAIPMPALASSLPVGQLEHVVGVSGSSDTAALNVRTSKKPKVAFALSVKQESAAASERIFSTAVTGGAGIGRAASSPVVSLSSSSSHASRITTDPPTAGNSVNMTTISGASIGKKPAPTVPASSGAFDLTDEGVARYIRSMGGKIAVSTLKEYYKPIIKSIGKQTGDPKFGTKKLLDILLRITVNHDDPILGKVLKLASESSAY